MSLVDSFVAITATDAATARRYLTGAAANNLEMALTAYFDAGEDAGVDVPDIPPEAAMPSYIEPVHVPPPPEPDVILPPLVESRVPLQHVRLTGSLLSLAADLKASLKYKNTGSAPIEALFSFRQEKSCVYGASVVKPDGTIVKMEAKETEDALDQYDDAISAGHVGVMFEADGPSALRLSIGNLAPGEELSVDINYIQEVGFDSEGFVELVLPLASCVPKDGLEVDIDIENAVQVECTSEHSVAIERKDSSARVSLQSHGKMQRELRLRIELIDKEAVALVETGDEYSAFSCCFVPTVELSEAEDVKCELVFVCDRSGSMAGSRMKQTANALNIFLASIPEGCTFNIVSFGDSMEKVFPSSQPVNKRSFEQARSAINSFQANLGGTNILRPLEAVLSAPITLPRQVILLTDGDISNVDEVLELVRSHKQSGVRIFSLGIGQDAGPALVYGVAREGGGSAEFCASGQRIETYCERQLNRALAPIIVDVSVQSDIPMRVITPSKFLAFHKQPIVVYGILEEFCDVSEKQLQLTVRLSSGGQRTFSAPFRTLQQKGVRFQRLAVRSLVAEGHSVVQDALRLSVVCKGVSLVAVVEGNKAASAPMQVVNVREKVNDDLTEVMKDNIANLLDRGDRLEDLAEKSEDLAFNTNTFSRQTSSMGSGPGLGSRAADFISGLFKRNEPTASAPPVFAPAAAGAAAPMPPRQAQPPAPPRARKQQQQQQQQDQQLREMEQEINEIRAMSSEIGQTVQEQGSMLSFIESNVVSSQGRVDSTSRYLEAETKRAKKGKASPKPVSSRDAVRSSSKRKKEASTASRGAFSSARTSESEAMCFDDDVDEEEDERLPVVTKTSATRPVDILVQLQSFDGSYKLSPDLDGVAGCNLLTIKPTSFDEVVWATLVAVYLFQTRFSGEAKLVLKKARKFLLKQLKSSETLEMHLAQINF